ncbi:MAG: hypothetical protein NC489_35765 [Ruminococcus flavefaciens]|nr:hypothetical protein [Eubacterium sp.]MCM1235488.1 hypothetical protein [Ruminococcus flavefaciens]
MAKKNIFLCDVDIPKIVQDKAEEAFSTIIVEGKSAMKKNTETNQNMERNENMKWNRKITKIMAAVAACAAIALVSTAVAGRLEYIHIGNQEATGNDSDHYGLDRADASQEAADISEQETTDKEEEGLLSALDKVFTLHVKAAETDGGQAGGEQSTQLLAGQPVPLLSRDKANSWVMGGHEEDGGIVDYCINMPFTCVGDHIEKVTYSINNGAFQIVQPENETIIVDGQLYEGELNTGSIGGDYNEENDGLPSRPFETVLYRSFTLDYNRQSDEYTWINICNERHQSKEIFDLIWGDGKSMEDENNGMQQMLDNTVITCTVEYSDHTSQSVNIHVNSKIMSCAEAGEESKYEGERSIYFTFELQE